MRYLLLTTLIWAFSFSLIGEFLAGNVDSYFSAWVRMMLALIVFVPFMIKTPVPTTLKRQLVAIGAIQLGLMYIFYFYSFKILSVPEVLLFTITTPIYIALINDLLNGRFHPQHLIWAAVSVLGAYIIRLDSGWNSEALLGFFVVQGANLSFATGQVFYARLKRANGPLPAGHFGYFFVGAALVASIALLLFGKFETKLSIQHSLILLWLGLVASALGYFMWNKGASMVSTGSLAAMNNALIPAGLAVNLIVWQKDINFITTAIGAGLIFGAVFMDQYWTKRAPSS